ELSVDLVPASCRISNVNGTIPTRRTAQSGAARSAAVPASRLNNNGAVGAEGKSTWACRSHRIAADSMARTSLMRSLVTLVRAQATAVPSPGAAYARGLTRRQFVSAVAGLGLAGCARAPRSVGRAPAVAIVGGGIAGLTAALTLVDAGIPAIVYEASTRVG